MPAACTATQKAAQQGIPGKPLPCPVAHCLHSFNHDGLTEHRQTPAASVSCSGMNDAAQLANAQHGLERTRVLNTKMSYMTQAQLSQLTAYRCVSAQL